MTAHKEIQKALKKCEEKFFRVFRESPLVLELTSAQDDRFIEINDTFERRTGWKRDEVIGRTPYDLHIFIDPSQRAYIVHELLSGGAVRNLELHGRMKNGEVRTGSASAALIEISGEPCVLTLIEDTTDLKGAEEAKQAAERLSRTLHRLIQAHDEEHASTARDLHKYIDCLMLLSVGLDRLHRYPPLSVLEVRQQIGKARQQIEDLVNDIQILSNHLYPSKLEYLGLSAAASSLCRELSHQENIEIEFVSEGLPQDLPKEISFCLFNVLQDALQNAVNHSGSVRLHVSLQGGADEVFLTVRDSGVGFDPEEAPKGSGLGLTVMKERLKLVGGELSIESGINEGTTISARVPLKPVAKADGSAG
jgi:PAS domain S-box-containing protein